MSGVLLDSFSPLPSSLFAELWLAYLQARKGKRSKRSVMQAEHDPTPMLMELAQQLESKTWQPGRYTAFLVQQPVLREIFAAPFRDRVVHHFLYNRICAAIENQLVYDCSSCRVGKGTHFAVQRVKRFLRAASEGHSQPVWVLRLDIQAYFVSIRRDRLYSVCHAMLVRAGLAEHPEWELTEWLLAQICFHDPTSHVLRMGEDAEWAHLPRSKSLYHAARGCGLPIGNLTSQLFGNVYLDALDQYIKRELGIAFYSRYVDDMVLLHRDRDVLKGYISKVRNWLTNERSLTMHPGKIHLSMARAGFPYLGAYILPGRIYAGSRVKDAFVRCCRSRPCEERSVQSYIGLLGHWDCTRLTANRAFPGSGVTPVRGRSGFSPAISDIPRIAR